MMKIGNLEVYGIIYKIENLVNGKVYIGQTIQGFDKRYSENGINSVEKVYNHHNHRRITNRYYNDHLLKSMNKYGLNNFKVNKIIDYAFSEYELNIKEKCWIQYYDSFYNGYNRTFGGDDSMKGKDNPSSRSIVQLDMNGNFIKQWDYMTEAQEYTGVNICKMAGVAKGERRSAGNYIWVYTEDYDINRDYSYKEYIPNTRKVVQLDLNGNFIKEYDGCQKASEYNGLNVKSINRCCLHERKSYANYIWMFKDEYDPNKNYSYNPKSFGKAKNVLVFDIDMNYIETLNNISEIVDKYGYSRSAITNHIVHRCGRSIKHHIFVYEEDYDESKKESYKIKRNNGSKEIVVLDNNMNYIETILGMNAISKKYKYSTTSIKNHLNHKPNKIKDHIFIYKEEYDKISR